MDKSFKIGNTDIPAKYVSNASTLEAFIAKCDKDNLIMDVPNREAVLTDMWTEVCGSAEKEEPTKVVAEPAKQDKPKPTSKK